MPARRGLLAALLLFAAPAFAAPDPGALCLAAADRAGAEHGVPAAVMRAITRTETGRARGGALQPWPWTVNMEGAGKWFDARAEALAYVRREQARGARSFDVGCFQVNHLWHGDAFPSLETMIDPAANADYAARFLRALYDETGEWPQAAAFYHSRTPKYASRYRARFEKILAAADDEAPVPQTVLADAPAAKTAGPETPAPWRTAAVAAPTAGGVALRMMKRAAGPLARRAAGSLFE